MKLRLYYYIRIASDLHPNQVRCIFAVAILQNNFKLFQHE